MQILEGILKPLREALIKVRIKVNSDSNYQVFLTEIQAIHTQMEGIVLPALEALCGAEALDKGTLGAQELVKMSDRFAKQTVLLKHHITGARAATTRFSGILGVDVGKK